MWPAEPNPKTSTEPISSDGIPPRRRSKQAVAAAIYGAGWAMFSTLAGIACLRPHALLIDKLCIALAVLVGGAAGITWLRMARQTEKRSGRLRVWAGVKLGCGLGVAVAGIASLPAAAAYESHVSTSGYLIGLIAMFGGSLVGLVAGELATGIFFGRRGSNTAQSA